MEEQRVRKVIEVALAAEQDFFGKSRAGDAAVDKDAEEEWSDLASRREEE